MRTSKGKKRYRVYKVCVVMPDNVVDETMMDYIKEAVMSFKGGLESNNPLTFLESELVEVKRLSPTYSELR